MEKDVEKILENMVVPEMEYVKTKNVAAAPEVPEVVLPKTKAEMYREAKGRLDQKTVPVSKSFDGKKLKKSGKKQRPETAATAEAEATAAPKTVTIEQLKQRIGSLRRIVDAPKWVGSADEIVPFAWRNPLSADIEKPSKVYRAAAGIVRPRSLLLPVPHKNN